MHCYFFEHNCMYSPATNCTCHIYILYYILLSEKGHQFTLAAHRVIHCACVINVCAYILNS